MTDFTAKRADAEHRLVREREARGTALLDGKPVTHKRVADAEGDIAAITEAEGVAATRQRAEAAIALRQRRTAIIDEISLTEAARLEAIAAAERAARAFVSAVNGALAAAAGERRLLAQIAAETPTPLGELALVDRLASRTAALLATITGCRTAFGSLQLLQTFRSADDNWRDREAAEVARSLTALKGN